MGSEFSIRVTGEAGQGIETVGAAFLRLFKQAGYHVFAYQDYMSRIRGGNNFYQIRVSQDAVYAPREKVDVLVCLNSGSVGLHLNDLADGGVVLVDCAQFHLSPSDSRFFDLPFFSLAMQAGGSQLFINSVCFGAVAGLAGLPFSEVAESLSLVFFGNPGTVLEHNHAAAKAGYDFVRARSSTPLFPVALEPVKRSLLLNGHDGLVMGAIKAGCKFYAAYPMTPATGILNAMARHARRFSLIVEQAEDEIAAINMALGASFAGVRAMTGTSGGGFALMAEGVSLAGMTETPVVIVVSQRPAPATGLPTRTEQADLEFVLSSGHGEFARAIYTPGDPCEAYYLTIQAFNIAEKYQIPVFILTDQHLADSYRDVEWLDPEKVKVQRYLISKRDSSSVTGYQRYRFSETGVSERAVPSWIDDPVYVDSDEHTEEGHITEDAQMRTKMVEKRLYRKLAGLKKEVEGPTVYNIKNADKVLIGFGSTLGVLREVAGIFAEEGVGCIHLSQVWPFPAERMKELLAPVRRVFTLENNASGQLARLLRRETGIAVDGSFLKYDGRPFILDRLIARLHVV